jgi:hypothetical protein
MSRKQIALVAAVGVASFVAFTVYDVIRLIGESSDSRWDR